MKRLSEAIKRRVVEHLACFRTHAEVSQLITEEFDVSLTPRHVRAYDPMCFQFAGGQKWREYHAFVRKRFSEEVGEVPIVHRAYRLRQLQRQYLKADEAGNVQQAVRALETAAKEVGNVYAPHARSHGAVRAEEVSNPMEAMSPEERRNRLADLLSEGIERWKAKNGITDPSTEH